MMNEFLYLLLALLEGGLLGVFFFGGLWWTVRKLSSTKHVALLFLGSMILRTGIVVLGFYFIIGDNWQHLVAGLLGFVIARMFITRISRIANQSKPLLRKAGHES
ncbi:ATP synthase subunit I [Hydrogenovibrio sp. 3SP14C1]|uniref:ATP synthase subunit I n=1 Tax=Hydrogenovibrio sp. 3SP14C1 TaxID=3038774 RepID=UPI0024176349|nr:ATP synthase subunit I [Hydrogenovibrio sp. 3SP14C1]MDG4813031.1 ATP synthase subunit I [Hydrogenovibrio sp. 3SP14C1]